MEGTVLAMSVSAKGHRSISVKTDYGVLRGIWCGATPNLNATVFFELEFESDLVTGHKAGFTAVSPIPGDVLLAGIAEAWHSGVLDLRIGKALVQIELPNPPECGSWFAVKGHCLMLFDANL